MAVNYICFFFSVKSALSQLQGDTVHNAPSLCSFKKSFQIAVGEETAHVEIAGNRVLNQLAIAFHLRHMISADRHIETQLAVGTHQLKLVGVALIMEKLSEVGLVSFNIAHMDEGNALSKVARNTA